MAADARSYWSGWLAWVMTALLAVVGMLAFLSVGIVLLVSALPIGAVALMSWRHP